MTKPSDIEALIDRGIDAHRADLAQGSRAAAMPRRRRGRPTPAGRAALQPRPMTAAEIYGPGGLVERTRASTEPHRIESGRRTSERWERHRAARGGQ